MKALALGAKARTLPQSNHGLALRRFKHRQARFRAGTAIESAADFGILSSDLLHKSQGGSSLLAKPPTRLPGNGANAQTVADLHQDGFLDIVIANEFNGTKTELSSYIYWGGPKGYGRRNRTELPTVGATAVAAADLNHDGHADLVFASSGRSY